MSRSPTATAALAWTGRQVLRMLWASHRRPDTTLLSEELERVARPTILLAWHDESFAIASYLRTLVRHHELGIMASLSDDGGLVTAIAEPLGVHVVRGSASRGGSAGLRALFRAVTRSGVSPLILPDGPRGPQFEVKPGAIVLAQMTGASLLPLHFPVSGWQRRLKSWDRMVLPLAGARIQVRVGEPLRVPRELPDPLRDELCAEAAERLDRLRVP